MSVRLEPDEDLFDLTVEAAHLRFGCGDTLTVIAAAFESSWHHVAGWLRRHGTFANPRLVLSHDQAADIEARVVTDGSAEKAAAAFGVTVDGLSTLLGRRRSHGPGPGAAALDDAQVADLLRRYVGGTSVGTLGVAFGVTTRVVTDLVAEAGLTPAASDGRVQAQPFLSYRQAGALARRRAEGADPDEIAQEMNLPEAAVRMTLACGVMGTLGDQLARLDEQARERLVARCTVADVHVVAAEFGVEVRAVQQVLREHADGSRQLPGRVVALPRPGRAARRSVSDEQADEILYAFADGVPVRRIAARFRLGVGRVTEVLQARGVPPGALAV